MGKTAIQVALAVRKYLRLQAIEDQWHRDFEEFWFGY
jgi:hypothetical protein